LYYKKSSSQHDQCAILVFSTRPSSITSNFSRNRANTRTYWKRTLLRNYSMVTKLLASLLLPLNQQICKHSLN